MNDEREAVGFFARAAALASGIYHSVMEDGKIQAGIRQGFQELGNAFGQVWPDQISVSEPGSIGNPLFSDLAETRDYHADAAREAFATALPSPSEIANTRSIQPPADRGQEHGREM